MIDNVKPLSLSLLRTQKRFACLINVDAPVLCDISKINGREMLCRWKLYWFRLIKFDLRHLFSIRDPRGDKRGLVALLQRSD